MLDVLIRGGWVADGTGSPPFLGDVAIEGGHVVEVGRLGAQRGEGVLRRALALGAHWGGSARRASVIVHGRRSSGGGRGGSFFRWWLNFFSLKTEK